MKVDLRTDSLVSLPSAALIYCRAYVMSDYVSFTGNVFIRIRFSVKWFFARHCVLYRPKTWVLNKIQTSSPRKFVNVLTRQNSPYWLMLFIRCSTGTGYTMYLCNVDKTRQNSLYASHKVKAHAAKIILIHMPLCEHIHIMYKVNMCINSTWYT